MGFYLAKSAPNAVSAKTALAAKETSVDAVETAPTKARERTASQHNQGPVTHENNWMTYFRKNRKGVEPNRALRQSHESNLAPKNEFSLGNIVSNSGPIDDIDIPIALRKKGENLHSTPH